MESSTFSSSLTFTTKMTKFSLPKSTWIIEDCNFYRVKPIISYKPLESPVFYAPEHDLQFKTFFWPNGTSDKPDAHRYSSAAYVQAKRISSCDNDGTEVKSSYWKEDAVIVINYTIKTKEENHCQAIVVNKNKKKGAGKYSFRVNSPTLKPSDPYNYEDNGLLTTRFDGQLVLECNIKVSYLTDSFSGICCLPSLLTSTEVARRGDHFEKMKALLETNSSSDVTLVAGDQEFKVHKLHLSTHSEVFAAMFQHENTKEAIEKKVLIEDVSAETMRTLLFYIYTGTVESTNELSIDLFSAADKYHVDALKVDCERQLSLQLTTESVCSLLLHADLHNASTLKKNCIKFITFHSAEMMSNTSPVWKQFTTSARPELADEVRTQVLAKFGLAELSSLISN